MYERYNYSCAESDVFYFKSFKLANILHLTLFDSMVTLILLYGCEAWGIENIDVIEKLYIRYCKYVLHLKT